MTKQIVNKYGGTCEGCGKQVPAGSGVAEKDLSSEKSRWIVRCRPCVDGSEPTPAPVAKPLDERPAFPLTDEQEEAVRLFAEGLSIAIQAGAGTGKTSTLVAIAKSTGRIGKFVAFNKAIVTDAAAKLPPNVSASTAHSLAYQQVGKDFRHRLDSARQDSNEIARRLRIQPFFVEFGEQRKAIQPSTLAGYVMKAIGSFCNSADAEPGPMHVAYVDGIDLPTEDGTKTYEQNDRLRKHLAPALAAAWEDLQRTDGELRFSPDVYLKIWQLGLRGKPVIPGEFILFDEAQDANPVLLDVVEQQGKQVVFVGDAQQQIYTWRGAIDAMSSVPAEQTCFLTNSFRFGPEIADAANKVLGQIESAQLRLVGKAAPGKVEAHDSPEAILCRTNAGAIRIVLDEMEKGRSTHLVGGSGDVERFAKAARDLQNGKPTDHPELACFDSWEQVQDYVQLDAMGDELAPLVRLLDDYGVETVLRATSTRTSETDADVVVSTAHKAKGREWDVVRLASDFPIDRMGDSEYRLLYVALTRARRHLDIEICPAAIEVVFPERAQEARDLAEAQKKGPQGSPDPEPAAPGPAKRKRTTKAAAAPDLSAARAIVSEIVARGPEGWTPALYVRHLAGEGYEVDVQTVVGWLEGANR